MNKTDTQSAAHLLKILSWLVFFVVGTVVLSVLVVDLVSPGVEKPDSNFWPIISAFFVFACILLFSAIQLNKHQQWARYAAGFLAIVSLIAFPVGTAMGLLILSYLHKGWHEV